MNELKFSELPVEKQKERREWLQVARAHLANEHERWGESLFKTLTLANTGGIVVVAGLITSVSEFRASICLRLSLTFFVLGLILTLNAIRHEFSGVAKRIDFWDRNLARYLGGATTFGEFYEPIRKHSEITVVDRLIAWAPGVSFFVGSFIGFVFLWS